MLLIIPFKLFISVSILTAGVKCSSINNKLSDAHFEYPGPAISERDLPICPPHAVCSVLHKRFWMAPIVMRLCRCLRRIECPWQWTDYTDNNTMHLDNRSQFKFCDEVSELSECTQRKPALTVITTASKETKSALDDISTTPTIEEERKLAVNVSCLCPPSFTWQEQHQKQIVQNPENGTVIINHYKCTPMKKCSSLEFCGNVRADYFSTYYHCSCPIEHMCVNKNRTLVMANELLYDGQVYKAFCYPQT